VIRPYWCGHLSRESSRGELGVALLVASLVLGPMFGPTLGLPQWSQDLSPFTHIPKAPALDVTAAPLIFLASICVALAVAGIVAIRRRNLILPA
jgi:ABC-2 type transport system permease protein